VAVVLCFEGEKKKKTKRRKNIKSEDIVFFLKIGLEKFTSTKSIKL